MSDSMVTARVHPSIKKKLALSGYTARQAIEYFVQEYYSENPERELEIQKDLLYVKLNELENCKSEIQSEIDNIREEIKQLEDDQCVNEK